MRSFTLAALLFLATLTLAAAYITHLDPLEHYIQKALPTAIRWYNIEGAPFWARGAKPKYSAPNDVHIFSLDPGQETFLILPPKSLLRLHSTKPITPDLLEIGLSIDGKAFLLTPTLFNQWDPTNLFVKIPYASPTLVWIQAKQTNPESLNLAAFIAVRTRPQLPTLYRSLVSLDGPRFCLPLEAEPIHEPFTLAHPEHELQCELPGPTWIQIVGYLPWPESETRSLKFHTLHIQVNDSPPKPTLLVANHDPSRFITYQNKLQPISRRLSTYVYLPNPTNLLRIKTLAPIFLKAYSLETQPLLVPKLNEPTEPLIAPTILPRLNLLYSTPPFGLLQTYHYDIQDLIATENTIVQLLTDNEHLDSGGQAVDLNERLAEEFPDIPELMSMVTLHKAARTFWREILPANANTPLSFQMAYAVVPLLPPDTTPPWLIVVNPTLYQIHANLATGRFIPVPTNTSRKLVYFLPPRAHNSKLRVSVLTSGSVTLRIQYDEDPPHILRVNSDPYSNAPGTPFFILATTRVIQHLFLKCSHPIPPFDLSFDLPLPWVIPAIAELDLPHNVRTIYVDQLPNETPCSISLAYLADMPFELGESDLLSALNAVKLTNNFRVLFGVEANPEESPSTLQTLHNHFLPMRRLLEQHWRDFTNGLIIPPNIDARSQSVDPTTIQKAKDLESRGFHIEALEYWNALFWSGYDRLSATESIIKLLHKLGEEYLAKQYAKLAILTAPPNTIPEPAIQILEEDSIKTEDLDSLEQVRAALFLKDPSAETLHGLIEAFYKNGRDEFVLFASLLLPPRAQPTPEMLSSALRLNWWTVFETLVERIPDPQERNFWLGLKSLTLWNFQDAERYLANANTLGKSYRDHLLEGLAIRRSLGSTNLLERVNAILEWERWYAATPGPVLWEDAPYLIGSFESGEVLRNIERNNYISYFSCTPETPATIQVLGPAKIRFEIRIILPAGTTTPTYDWIEIIQDGLTNRLPLAATKPNPLLEITSRPESKVSEKTIHVLDFGPGLHELVVRPRTNSILMRLKKQVPAWPTYVLPPPSPDKILAVLEQPLTPWLATTQGIRTDGKLWIVPSKVCTLDQFTQSKVQPVISPHVLTHLRQIAPLHYTQIALRVKGVPLDSNLAQTILSQLPPSERWLVAKKLRMEENSMVTNASLEEQALWLLNSGRFTEFVEHADRIETHRQLWFWLELAELHPEWELYARSRGLALILSNNIPSLAADKSRLRENCQWITPPLPPTTESLKPISLPIDYSLTPGVRTRLALLPPKDTNWFNLTANQLLNLTINTTGQTQLKLEYRVSPVGFVPLHPVTLAAKLNETTNYISIQPENQEGIWLTNLPAGNHALSLWIIDPVANHVIQIKPIVLQGNPSDDQTPIPVRQSTQTYFFHYTDRQNPMAAQIEGPTLVRIDYWESYGVKHEYKFIPAGTHTILVPPRKDSIQDWCRLSILTIIPNKVEPEAPVPTREPSPALGPAMPSQDKPPFKINSLADFYALGGQEDGTWYADLTLARTRPFEIEPKSESIANKFAELSIGYKYRDISSPTWMGMEGLVRVHHTGDLTFGLNSKVEARPQNSKLAWEINTGGFLGTIDNYHSLAGSLYADLQVGPYIPLTQRSQLHPFGMLYGRWLSLDTTTACKYEYIDHDLYTYYRALHRWGLTTGMEYHWQPWLDTLFQTAISITSNEDFSPDNCSYRITLHQLLYPARLQIGYRIKYFLSDKDRLNDHILHGILGGIAIEKWLSGKSRIEVATRVSIDWPGPTYGASITLRLERSNGRIYRDHSPSEITFRGLRTTHFPRNFNNSYQ